MTGFGALGEDLLLPALSQYNDSVALGDPAVHDVCAVASVAEPSVFGYTPARVEVETAGRLTSGMTVTSFGAAAPNASVATRIDSGAFWDLVLGTYGELAASMG
jgi:purine nucleosidase